MKPRQAVAMVLTFITGIGLVAAALCVPIGVALNHYVQPITAHTTGEHLPPNHIAVYDQEPLALLVHGALICSSRPRSDAGAR